MKDKLLKTAKKGLELQNEDGSLKEGHNGPWNDNDTPVRVTAHWAIIFSYAYKKTKKKIYKESAIKCGKFLIEKGRYEYAFHCRDNKSKSNGLIGQAWAIEGLVELYETFGEKKFLDVAEEVILHHDFNRDLGLWCMLGLTGQKLRVNRVLNQQVWFAVMAKKVHGHTKNFLIADRIQRFLEKLPEHINFNGRYITHIVYTGVSKKIVQEILEPLRFRKFSINQISRGYLSFTLYGLAMLKELGYDHPVINTYVEQSIQYMEDFVYPGNSGTFAWSYNPTGIEMEYVNKVFKKKGKKWLQKQLDMHYGEEVMNKNTKDPVILQARIYEIIRAI